MSSQICPLCGGAGSRVTFLNAHRQFWICQACGGDGAIEAFGPPTLRIGSAQMKFLKAESMTLDQIEGEGGGRFSISGLGDRATMANIAVAMKIFPSLGQARKNGFDQPLSPGTHFLTKKKIRVEIVE